MIGVCIPAHNEEKLIADCLHCIFTAASHPDLNGESVKVVLVLDSCQDMTPVIAMKWPVISLETPARNVGKARALGAEYLLKHGARWLAFTDADTCVSSRWLADQLSLQSDVVCGTVEVDDWSDHGKHAKNSQKHFESTYIDNDGHRHVHGANLGISAFHYQRAGGFEPLGCGEDQALVDRLSILGAHIAWSALPRVRTSGRAFSRVKNGFAGALRQAWCESNDAENM